SLPGTSHGADQPLPIVVGDDGERVFRRLDSLLILLFGVAFPAGKSNRSVAIGREKNGVGVLETGFGDLVEKPSALALQWRVLFVVFQPQREFVALLSDLIGGLLEIRRRLAKLGASLVGEFAGLSLITWKLRLQDSKSSFLQRDRRRLSQRFSLPRM